MSLLNKDELKALVLEPNKPVVFNLYAYPTAGSRSAAESDQAQKFARTG